MRLSRIRVQNLRSIRDSGDIQVRPIFALIGENNSGKSNLYEKGDAPQNYHNYYQGNQS